jgi:hypothetical protein
MLFNPKVQAHLHELHRYQQKINTIKVDFGNMPMRRIKEATAIIQTGVSWIVDIASAAAQVSSSLSLIKDSMYNDSRWCRRC